jgi:hypothetical protein
MLPLTLAAAVLPTQVPPVDQCIADPSFVQFRSDLRRTIARHDTDALLKVVADDVHASLGGHIGKKDFIELWDLKGPRTSKVWKELGDALRLGCTMSNGVATAPSFEDQLGGDRDAFETMIALPGARLLRRPNDGASVVANLKWNVLTMREAWDGGPWIAVRLDDGRSGFVRRALARSPIDYRAWFRKREGKWRMEGFLAGD